jgi:hypothetical protein
MHGNEDGETGVDDDVAAQGFEGIGAYILGRNMFGPVRGPWSDGRDEWKGWWGDEPRITRRSLGAPITHALRSRWRAALSFLSSLTAFTQPSSRQSRQRAVRTCD